MEELEKLSGFRAGQDVPQELLSNVAQMAIGLPVLFNTLNIRRAILPAANGHCSARALARYYAVLGAGGAVPPPRSGGSEPPLGSHVHTPKFPTMPSKKKKKKGGSKNGQHDVSVADKDGYTQLRTSDGSDEGSVASAVVGNGSGSGDSMFGDGTKMLDAFMGVGDFSGMIHPNGKFGLGFRRYGYGGAGDKVTMTFGHSGMGGSTGFCDVEHGLAMAVTVNKMSLGGVTRRVVRLVCEELGVPVPDEFSVAGDKGPDMVLNLAPPE